jgi:hypothetical protein
MMNWFTQAIAWDLQRYQKRVSYKKKVSITLYKAIHSYYIG